MTDPDAHKPIFFDQDQARWPIIRNIFLVLGGCLGILFVLLLLSFLLTPVMPALQLKLESLGHHGPSSVRAPSGTEANPELSEFRETKQALFNEKK